MKFADQSPPPSALLFAIRAIGYTFESAVADIIDNSISAGATEINILASPYDEPYFAFLDNGCGMDAAELKNALQLASDRSQKPDAELELGRFGLGLKSASFSQCRRFYVVSVKAGKINAMTYGLDDVEQSGKWRTGILEKNEWRRLPEVERLMQYEHGTLVIWNDFDRLSKNTSNFESSFRRAVEQAKKHVEYVFHRYYDNVAIYFYGDRIEKRDPFLLDSYGTQQEGRAIDIDVDGHKVRITPYSLPYANTLNSDQLKLLGNPKSIYDEQGLYLYRNKRLIAWGSWFRTEVRSELNKLARVKVDIPSSLDEVWMLDVKKSSAKIPDKIKEKIRVAISDSIDRSRGAVKKPSEKESMAEHKVWQRTIVDKTSVRYAINQANPLLVAIRSVLDSKALSLFDQFVNEVQDYLPKHQIHIDQAGDKKIVNGDVQAGNIASRISKLAAKIRDVEDLKDRMYMLDRYLAFETHADLKQYKTRILKEASDG